jgi:type IV pilus assembly protein PilP
MNKTARIAALAVAFALAACEEQPPTATTADFDKARKEEAARVAAAAKNQPAPGALGKGAKGKSGAAAVVADGGVRTQYGASSASYTYDPTGKRDPFRSFVRDKLSEDTLAESPLEQFELGQLTISGVVWQADRRRALVLDPAGQAYVVKTGDRIGKNDGVVTEIGDSALVVLESYIDFHGDKTEKEIEMRIRQSTGG